MVFSKNIIKVGRASVLNGIVTQSGDMHLFFSKEGNKVYEKSILFSCGGQVNANLTPISFSEVIPLSKGFKVTRNVGLIGLVKTQ